MREDRALRAVPLPRPRRVSHLRGRFFQARRCGRGPAPRRHEAAGAFFAPGGGRWRGDGKIARPLRRSPVVRALPIEFFRRHDPLLAKKADQSQVSSRGCGAYEAECDARSWNFGTVAIPRRDCTGGSGAIIGRLDECNTPIKSLHRADKSWRHPALSLSTTSIPEVRTSPAERHASLQSIYATVAAYGS